MTDRPRRRGAIFLVIAFLSACPDEGRPRLYRTEPVPPAGLSTDVPLSMLSDVAAGTKRVPVDVAGIRGLKFLGPSLMEDAAGAFRGVNFGVFSHRAEKVQLLLFDDPESSLPTRQFDLSRQGDVWNLFVEGVGLGQHYGYVAWGPNWRFDAQWFPGSTLGYVADVDDEGNRFNPNKLLFDPYCKAFHRDHDWSKGSLGSGADRAVATWGAAMKCRIVQSTYAWSPGEEEFRKRRLSDDFEGHRPNDLILYEVHAKGFTANAPIDVEWRGTFRGFTERADYFAELGVTAVELMPVMEKPLDGGYWGYNSLSFFAPELSLASRREGSEVLDEFKALVEALHARGIEVILDVVYNHTGEGGLWRQKIYPFGPGGAWNLDPQETAGLYAYRGLDNWSYYALADGNRGYSNNTGVGNETRCNNLPMRRLIIDSLRWWVEEMHVDGFRFDLAPVLGERDLDYGVFENPLTGTVVQEIIDDPVLQRRNTRIIAEPWGGGGGGFQLGKFPSSANRPGYAWSEWNSRFRDWWRSFVNAKGDYQVDGVTVDADWKLNDQTGGADGGFVLTGSRDYFTWNGRGPHHSINFVTVHDGMTMFDLVSFDRKVNDCGPLNPVCCDRPYSPYCDEAKKSGENNNRSRSWGDEELKRQLMRDWFLALMVSHGTPLLLGGDEWLRTQLGNNNTYTPEADNAFSWFDWGAWEARDERHRMFDFVKQVIRLRKEHGYAFAPATYDGGAPFSWRTSDNQEAVGAGPWSRRSLMIHYFDPSRGPELVVLVNLETAPVTFQLPAGRRWRLLVDTRAERDSTDYLGPRGLSPRRSANAVLDAPEVIGPTYPLPARTLAVAEAL